MAQSSFVDYQAIKAAYTFEQAVRYLGLAVEKSGEQLRCACPTCKTGGPRGLAITPGKGFYCFGAKRGGDVISLVAHIKGIGQKTPRSSFRKSWYSWYQRRALPHVSAPSRKPVRQIDSPGRSSYRRTRPSRPMWCS
jgi:hypothetical protein